MKMENKKLFNFSFLFGVVGNVLEHYDKHLFIFLAPFLAPLFFKTSSSTLALILTYNIVPLSFLARPIGAFFFGRIGDNFSRKKALSWSLIGMAITTVSIGCLPTDDQAKTLAPIILLGLQMLQNFFSAGQRAGGPIIILENCQTSKRSLLSSLYDSSSILGILAASLAVSLLSNMNLLDQFWRALYWVGALSALVGAKLRFFNFAETPQIKAKPKKTFSFQSISKYLHLLIPIALVSALSYTIFDQIFSFMVCFPIALSDLKACDLIKTNPWILTADLLLLPLFGLIATTRTKKTHMLFFIALICIFSLPLYQLAGKLTLFDINVTRFILTFLGVGFSAPMHAWAVEITPQKNRYTLISMGYAIGGLIGKSLNPLGLWALFQTKSVLAPASLLLSISTLAGLSILLVKSKQTALKTA